MKCFFGLLFVLSIFVVSSQPFVPTREIPFEALPKFGLSFGAQFSDTKARFTFRGPSDTWYGIGWHNTVMDGSDALIITTGIGGIDPTMSSCDYHLSSNPNFDPNFTDPANFTESRKNLPPILDMSQDWTMLSNVVSGGMRTVVAERDLSTGDPDDNPFNPQNDPFPIIYARAPEINRVLELVFHEVDGCDVQTLTVEPPATGGRDPEFQSLDGLSFKYDGPCSYIVSTNRCPNVKKEIYPIFEVIGHHGPSSRREVHTIVVKKISVNIWKSESEEPIKLEFLSNRLVKMNGNKIKFPYNDTMIDISLKHGTGSSHVHFETNFGLHIYWTNDAAGSFSLFTPSKMKICGLLGNNNGDETDDLQMKTGESLPYNKNDEHFQNLVNRFGDSWMVKTPNQPLQCTLYPKTSYQSTQKCSFDKKFVEESCELMLQKHFKELRGKKIEKCFNSKEYNSIDATRVYEDCVTEICACEKEDSKECVPKVAIDEFKKACSDNGVKFPHISWK